MIKMPKNKPYKKNKAAKGLKGGKKLSTSHPGTGSMKKSPKKRNY